MNPYEWVTRNYRLRHKRDIEELQSNLSNATSANAYSWIKKGKITKELAGNPKRVLDVGCGWGRELVRFHDAIGVDICLPFLKTAKNYTDNELVLSDACSLPFKDNSFDLVVMSEVIEHLEDPDEVLRQIKRVLEDGGRIIVQTPNKVVTGGKVISKKYGHVHEFTPSELIKLITKNGFQVLTRAGSTIPYVPSSSRFTWLNANKWFFKVWKMLDKIGPLKWDTIVLAERGGIKEMVSIIVPSLNEEKNIARLLKSLEEQTDSNFEIILVDGGSEDKTVEIARKYNSRTVLLRGCNEFPSRNAGAKLAKGDILLFTSADTIFPKSLLEKVLRKFEEDSELIAIRGLTMPYDGPLIGKVEYAAYDLLRHIASKMPKPFKRFSGNTNFLAVRKEIFKKLGGFCDDINADGLLGRKLVKTGKIDHCFDAYVFISARRMKHMGFIKFNLHYLYVLENYLWMLSSTKKFKEMKLQRKEKHREMHTNKNRGA